MARLWTNSIRGELSSGVTAGDTTLDAAIFAELPTVSAPDTLRLTLDPGRDEGLGKPEIVEVTAHSASSTSVTVTRAVETSNNGGGAQAWPSGTTVVHGFTADEADDLTSHRGSSSNPHSVTHGQTSPPTNNPHSVTAAQVGAAPTPHDLAAGHHNADTLANLNSKVSDATLISETSANATYQPASQQADLSDVAFHSIFDESTEATHTIVDITGAGYLMGGLIIGHRITGIDIQVDGATAAHVSRQGFTDPGGSGTINFASLPAVRFDQSLTVTVDVGSSAEGVGATLWTKLD